jgi:hypothetical protein
MTHAARGAAERSHAFSGALPRSADGGDRPMSRFGVYNWSSGLSQCRSTVTGPAPSAAFLCRLERGQQVIPVV